MKRQDAVKILYNSVYNEIELIDNDYFVFNENLYYTIDDEYIEINIDEYAKHRRLGNNHINDFLYCIELSIMNKDFYRAKSIFEEVTKDAPVFKEVIDHLLDELTRIKKYLVENDAEKQSEKINKFLNLYLK